MRDCIFNKEILQTKSLIASWPIDSFMKAYDEKTGLLNFAIEIDGNPNGNLFHDKFTTAMIVVRSYIEKSDRAKEDQKYVIGIRFYSFGDMATIDLISLDKGYHKEIVKDHIERMNWPVIDNKKLPIFTMNEEENLVPFIFVGGHLCIDEHEKVSFSGSSGDFGSNIIFSDANDVAAYVASLCGIGTINEKMKKTGEEFIDNLLSFMKDNKLKKDFYEKFVDYGFSKDHKCKTQVFNGQQLGALFSMKVTDRVVVDGDDILIAMVDEVTGGFGRYVMLSGVAHNMRKQKQQNK